MNQPGEAELHRALFYLGTISDILKRGLVSGKSSSDSFLASWANSIRFPGGSPTKKFRLISYVECGHPFTASVDGDEEDIVMGRERSYLSEGAFWMDDRPWRGAKRECHQTYLQSVYFKLSNFSCLA